MTNPQVESLLEHDAFLRALARRLLGDDAAADDVVQDAWLVALRSAKRPDEVRAGWLAGIVKNLVRRARRDGERRSRRERVVARADEVAPTDEACAERSLRRRIVEIVVALPEIYREPLLLRYYDGLSPQAIAERLSLPGSTVRTRIQRGLLRVRAHLENGSGNGHALTVALLAIAAPRRARHLLKAAGVAATLAAAVLFARTAPPAPRHVASHALAMAPDAGLPSLVASAPADAGEPEPARGTVPLLLEGVVRLPEGAVETSVRLEIEGVPSDVPGDAPFAIPWPKEGTVRVRATHAESEPLETVARVPGRCELELRRRALVPEEEIQPERAAEGEARAAGEEGAFRDGGALASPRAPRGTALEGIVRLPPGASARPVLLEAWRPGGARVRANVRGGERFSVGVAALLNDPRPSELRLRASHDDAAPREATVDVLFDPATGATVLPFVEIELLAAAVLEGVVELEGVGAAADATVAAFPYDGDSPAPVLAAAARTRPDGSFRLVVDAGLSYFVAAAAPGYRPLGASVPAETDTVLAPFVLLQGASITGRVRSDEGALPGASVRASLQGKGGLTLVLGPDAALAYEEGRVDWRSVAAATDGEGGFRIRGLAGSTYRVEVEALLGSEAPRYGAVAVEAPGAVDFDVPVARVVVVVRGGGGVPLEGASIEAVREDGSVLPRLTDAEGRAPLVARPGERLRVAVSARDHESEEREVVAETGEVPFDLVPGKGFGTIEVALYSLEGVPLPAACDFELTPDHGRIVWRKATVEDGRFVLRDLEPAAYRVVATLPGDFLPARGEIVLGGGDTAELPLQALAGGRIVLRILTQGPLPDVWVEGASDFGMAGFDPISSWTVTGDTLQSGLMEPGIYVVHVLAATGARSFPVVLKAGAQVKLLVPVD